MARIWGEPISISALPLTDGLFINFYAKVNEQNKVQYARKDNGAGLRMQRLYFINYTVDLAMNKSKYAFSIKP